jgi:hypothetical protein
MEGLRLSRLLIFGEVDVGDDGDVVDGEFELVHEGRKSLSATTFPWRRT